MAMQSDSTGATGQEQSVIATRQSSWIHHWRPILDIAATVVMLIAALILVRGRLRDAPVAAPRPAAPVPTEPLSLEGLPILGESRAKVGILMFSDFQCPYCGRFASGTMPTLRKRYVDKGLVRVAFRHMPLPIHNFAERAAEGAECAAEQGKFWPMHDALFGSPTKLDDGGLAADAASIGLDLATFRQCMAQPPSSRIQQDVELARSLGLTGTPSFLVGVVAGSSLQAKAVLLGSRPVEDFEKTLDSLLKSM